MIPRYYEDEEIEAGIIEQEWWTEDDQMERERDLKEGQDIRDEYDDEDADDLKFVL